MIEKYLLTVFHTFLSFASYSCLNPSLLAALSCLQSFSLEFFFEPNEFFTNTILTKTYKMRSEPDDSDPFSFDGPEIMGCTGYEPISFLVPHTLSLGINHLSWNPIL